jgi:hypothetical protein
MPQLMVHKKLEGIPKFQSQEAGNGDGDIDFVEADVSGLAQEIDEPDLILDEFVDDAAVEVGVEGILVLERFHFVEFLFGQHGLGKIVAKMPGRNSGSLFVFEAVLQLQFAECSNHCIGSGAPCIPIRTMKWGWISK